MTLFENKLYSNHRNEHEIGDVLWVNIGIQMVFGVMSRITPNTEFYIRDGARIFDILEMAKTYFKNDNLTIDDLIIKSEYIQTRLLVGYDRSDFTNFLVVALAKTSYTSEDLTLLRKIETLPMGDPLDYM